MYVYIYIYIGGRSFAPPQRPVQRAWPYIEWPPYTISYEDFHTRWGMVAFLCMAMLIAMATEVVHIRVRHLSLPSTSPMYSVLYTGPTAHRWCCTPPPPVPTAGAVHGPHRWCCTRAPGPTAQRGLLPRMPDICPTPGAVHVQRGLLPRMPDADLFKRPRLQRPFRMLASYRTPGKSHGPLI